MRTRSTPLADGRGGSGLILHELPVMVPAAEDRVDVADRLGPEGEAVLSGRIVVDVALRLADQPVRHVLPRSRIVAVLLRQADGVLHVAEPDVVGGQGELDPFLLALDRLLP